MDNSIQVCAVYPNGLVRIYGPQPKGGGPRPFVKSMQFSNYGQAVQFAADFEEQERRVAKISRSLA